MNSLVQMAHTFHSLREGVFLSAIHALELPSGSCGLDAGGRIGLQALMLAETVGPEGRITGLDLSDELLLPGYLLLEARLLRGLPLISVNCIEG